MYKSPFIIRNYISSPENLQDPNGNAITIELVNATLDTLAKAKICRQRSWNSEGEYKITTLQ